MAGNCDSLTCSREDGAITVGSHVGSRRTALQRDWLPSGIGRSALTCEDACAGTGCEGPSAAPAMQEVKDHLQDRNMPFNCGNVELRGFEPLTSCMPYRPRPTLSVAWHRLAGRLSCGDRGSTWPDVARLLPTLAPNLAPSKLTSSANDPIARTKPGHQTARAASSRTLADDRTGEDPPSDGRAGFPGAARPDPARAPAALPHAGRDHRR